VAGPQPGWARIGGSSSASSHEHWECQQVKRTGESVRKACRRQLPRRWSAPRSSRWTARAPIETKPSCGLIGPRAPWWLGRQPGRTACRPSQCIDAMTSLAGPAELIIGDRQTGKSAISNRHYHQTSGELGGPSTRIRMGALLLRTDGVAMARRLPRSPMCAGPWRRRAALEYPLSSAAPPRTPAGSKYIAPYTPVRSIAQHWINRASTPESLFVRPSNHRAVPRGLAAASRPLPGTEA